MKSFFHSNKSLIFSLLFLTIYSTTIVFAAPPTSPYTPTDNQLDPTCAPGDANCYVSVFPDQTSNTGKLLFTDGTNPTWASNLYWDEDNSRMGIGIDSSGHTTTLRVVSQASDVAVFENNLGRAHITIYNNNNNVNLTDGAEVGRLDFAGRHNNSDYLEVASISSWYKGDGTTRIGALSFNTYGISGQLARMYIDESGNTGIGTLTTTPAARLHVKGSGATSSTYTAQFHNSTGINNAFVIRDDGNIGIGTDAPTASLHVVGSVDLSTYAHIRISYEGDSITSQALPTWPQYVATYSPYFAKSANAVNYGKDGGRASQMVAEYSTGAHVNRPTRTTDEGWFFLFAGSNDLYDGVSASTVYGYLTSLWASARADGYKVVAFTILPRGPFDAAKEAQRVALNDLILSDQTLYDYVIRADLVLDNTADTDYFYDGTHPSVNGAQLIAQTIATTIDTKPWTLIPTLPGVTSSTGMNLILNPRGKNIGIGTNSPTGNLSIAQTLTDTGALKGIVYTGAVNTNQTLSTEIPSLTLTTVGRQWATGALTTQREVLITQPTYSFVGASTITNAATVGINGAPIAGTNATLTNSHGMLIQSGAVASGTTNSYGLTVNTQTGASNNYAAQFIGGNVGIGTATPLSNLHVAGNNIAVGAGYNSFGNLFIGTTDSQAINKGGSLVLGGKWYTGDGTSAAFATIHGKKENASDGNTSGYLAFETASATGGAPYSFERMRITSTGNVGIGLPAPLYRLDILQNSASTYASRIFHDGNNDNRWGLLIQAGATTPSSNKWIQFNDGDGTDQGSVCYTGGAAAICAPSDSRLKQNITDTSISLSMLNAIKVRDFSYISDESQSIIHGFVAQELYEAYPSAVSVPHNPNDSWKVSYAQLTPLIVKSVQEIDMKVTPLTDLSLDNANTLGSLIKSFIENTTTIFDQIFVKKIQTENIETERAEINSADINSAQVKQLCTSSGRCLSEDAIEQLIEFTAGYNSNALSQPAETNPSTPIEPEDSLPEEETEIPQADIINNEPEPEEDTSLNNSDTNAEVEEETATEPEEIQEVITPEEPETLTTD